jgi:hypothetical protein
VDFKKKRRTNSRRENTKRQIMKNNKKLMAVVAAGLACSASSSIAALTPISPGGSGTLTGTYTLGGGASVVGTLVSAYDVGTGAGEDKGTLTSTVYTGDGNNPLGGLTFVYTITSTIGDVTGLTVDGFGLPVQVANLVSTLALATGVTYGNFGNINFAWPNAENAPTTLSVVVDTSSRSFGINPANIQDATAANVFDLAPVPEPTTILAGALMLLPLGIGAVRSLRKERA